MLLLSQDKVLLFNELGLGKNPSPFPLVSPGHWNRLSEDSFCLKRLLCTSKISLTCFVKLEPEGICVSPEFCCISKCFMSGSSCTFLNNK